ncbi:MAG TPA: alpha-1,4-glucan--maltose-1-phosphate maltosyltransferase [Gaiellaceae bacterium]|nr:alpha-1,4-glucan--maltose-1-phosphate maltosyltransferase [Gaiellaceae bacterium]
MTESQGKVPTASTKQPPPRIQIQNVRPQVDCGRYPVKRTVGDSVEVTADVFKDGHDILRAVVKYRRAGTRKWLEAPLAPLGNDRWAGSFEVTELGRWQYVVEAWVDRYATLLDELDRKLAAEQVDLTGETAEAEALFGRGTLDEWRAQAPELGAKDRYGKVCLEQALEVDVERERARFGAWYELFPRSWGGFEGVERALPQLAELGFDVVYLPPIHPIGQTNRKGRNNALVAEPGDVGSPWAIGGPEGGHDAIHPELGTLEDFDRLVATAREVGVEIALDFAIQCSPDHPWLEQHPEWFNRRPDGTLKYAENPPKRYQDIYNVNFDSEDWRGLWDALRDVVLHWCRHGVRAFRVDNPHTKSVPFWEWLIREVRAEFPDALFFAEAFTRPTMMTTLAKTGFGQSYTYFTWKNTKAELVEFVEQLRSWSEFYRPNLFANTPDILHEYLQEGGPPAFRARLVLAATLSPSYGIYSGYEHFENVPVREGSEEYLDSEKYEVKERALDGPLLPLVARLNEVRRAEPALQRFENLRFVDTHSEHLLGYAKGQDLFVVVNLDPATPREGLAIVPPELGLPAEFPVVDLLSGERYRWRSGRNYVGLPPGGAHLLKAELGA